MDDQNTPSGFFQNPRANNIENQRVSDLETQTITPHNQNNRLDFKAQHNLSITSYLDFFSYHVCCKESEI